MVFSKLFHGERLQPQWKPSDIFIAICSVFDQSVGFGFLYNTVQAYRYLKQCLGHKGGSVGCGQIIVINRQVGRGGGWSFCFKYLKGHHITIFPNAALQVLMQQYVQLQRRLPLHGATTMKIDVTITVLFSIG